MDHSTRLAIAITLGVAVALLGGTAMVYMRPPQPAAVAMTAPAVVPAAVAAPKTAPVKLTESNAPDGKLITSAFMPLTGYPVDDGQKVEWAVSATFQPQDAEVQLYLKSETASWTCWESEAKWPAIIIGDDRRRDLKCNRVESRESGKVVTLVCCRGGLQDAIAIARAKNPRLLFGNHLCDLGPQGAETCRELVRMAGMEQQRRRGRSEADATDDVRTWLGEK